jgi:hypothetical protein
MKSGRDGLVEVEAFASFFFGFLEVFECSPMVVDVAVLSLGPVFEHEVVSAARDGFYLLWYFGLEEITV